jgi:hypothetical protein
MAEPGWGGKRTPRRPAPVSGPGQLSQRTDGGPQQVQANMSGMDYGDNQAMENLQSSAPMSASRSAGSPRARAREAGSAAQQATQLFSPTQRPDEPLTAGAPFGPGDGPPVQPGRMTVNQQDAQMLSKYLPGLMEMAQAPDTPDGFRRFVRHLRNMQGGM